LIENNKLTIPIGIRLNVSLRGRIALRARRNVNTFGVSFPCVAWQMCFCRWIGHRC